MKRLTAVIVACLVVLAGTATAATAATFKPGTYKGWTEETENMSLKLSKSKRITNFSARFYAICQNPQDPSNPLIVRMKPKPSVLGLKAKVDKKGKFSFTTNPFDAIDNGMLVLNISGKVTKRKKFKDTRIAGSFRVTFPASTIGRPEYGDCDTGKTGFAVYKDN